MNPPAVNVTADREDLRAMLREAVQSTPASSPPVLPVSEIEDMIARGVKSAFTQIGIDAKNPIAMQADFAFIRSSRKAWRAAVATAQGTAIGALVTGILTVLWIGIRSSLGK